MAGCVHGYYHYCISCGNLEELAGPGTTPVDVWQRNQHANHWTRQAREIMGPAPDEIQRDLCGGIIRIGP